LTSRKAFSLDGLPRDGALMTATPEGTLGEPERALPNGAKGLRRIARHGTFDRRSKSVPVFPIPV
jgi:hypothetical protein